MKRRMVAIMMALAMACSGTAIASDQQSESGSYVEITSGPLYENIHSIDPGFEISDSDGTLIVAKSIEGITLADVQNFFSSSAKILNLSDCKSYSSMNIMLYGSIDGEGFIENIMIFDYSGIDSGFTASLLNGSENDGLKALFQACFDTYYGAHTESAHLAAIQHSYDETTEFPDTYRNGFLWAMASFPNGLQTKVEGYHLTVTSYYPNSESGGKKAYLDLNSSVSLYNRMLSADSFAMPYTHVYLLFNDSSSTSETLWNVDIGFETGKGEVNIGETKSDSFLNGISEGCDVIAGEQSGR